MSRGRYWPEKLQPCGTPAAYRRHLRHHEPACRKCLDAHNQATKRSQEHHGATMAPATPGGPS